MARRRSRQTNANSDSPASFWTSYSDLFMAMAVVFLVVLVFVLIKAGVSQTRVGKITRSHKAKLIGKLPDHVLEKNREQQKKSRKSIEEMKEARSRLEFSFKDLTRFVEGIKKQENLIDELSKDQIEKNALLQEANRKILRLQKKMKSYDSVKKEFRRHQLLKKDLDHYSSLNQLQTGKLKNYQKELERLKSEIALKNRRLTEMNRTMKTKDSLSDVRRKNLESRLVLNVTQIKELEAQNRNARKKLLDLQTHLDDKRATLRRATTLRQKIANKLTDSLTKAGIGIQSDPRSGRIILKMDDIFYFKNDSYQLTATAKHKLKRVMPIYANGLLSHKGSYEKIQSITITGHASPSYRKKFIDPDMHDPQAYDYNLRLSINRATQIANYIFSKEIGSYPHKKKMKRLTRVSGLGYMEPIRMTRAIAGGNIFDNCGIYNCEESRRVEINFTIKGDSE